MSPHNCACRRHAFSDTHGETLRDIVTFVPLVPHGKFALRALSTCWTTTSTGRAKPYDSNTRTNDGALPARSSAMS